MRLFISGSAPLLIETFERVPRAHRPHHPRALRHERDGDADVATRTRGRRRAPRRHGRASRCPASACACVDAKGAALPGRRDRRASRSSGPNVFRGYWRMPEKTREEFTADGWFKTGDVGKIDGDGYVTIVGRSKDLIISGGYNVYPAEIEGFLNEMPGVAESAVIGVPHPDFGEAVVAVVVRAAGDALDPAALIAGAEDADRQLQGAQAGLRRRRAAAQHDGQGAEEPAARAAPGLVQVSGADPPLDLDPGLVADERQEARGRPAHEGPVEAGGRRRSLPAAGRCRGRRARRRR